MIDLYLAAEYHNASQLMEICVRVMVYEFPEVSKQEGFEKLNPQVIQKVKEMRAKYDEDVKNSKKTHELQAKLETIFYPK